MKLSYQNANPRNGHESYYIKFDDVSSTATNCVLVDSGEGVDVENDLGEDEYLSAVLLTHAHADHYQTIADNVVDGADVLVTPATSSVLETVLSEAEKHAEAPGVDWESINDAVVPITDWHSITSDIEVRPVPAGHVPGACGFLIRFEDDRHIFATGDFTFDRAAGYPALPQRKLSDLGIDVLFLNAATSRDGGITESIDTVLEQAVSGGDVVVSASGMTCVKYVYLLGHIVEELDMSLTVSVAGQAAKIYENLGYDVPNVSSHPVYESLDPILEADIAVAGPEKPTEGTSGKLFDEIEDDHSATLVRVLGSYSRWNESAVCTVNDFKRVNHPSEDELYSFVEELNPVHTVVQHGETRKWGDEFDFTLTWADDKTESRVLYSNGDWEPPGWLEEETYEMIIEQNRSKRDMDMSGIFKGDGVEEVLTPELPSPELTDDVDLDGEGVRMEEVRGRETFELSASDGEEDELSEDDEEAQTDETSGIQRRLERIEEILDAETHEAVVVDTHGGDLLLRVEGKAPDDFDLEDGDVVSISIDE